MERKRRPPVTAASPEVLRIHPKTSRNRWRCGQASRLCSWHTESYCSFGYAASAHIQCRALIAVLSGIFGSWNECWPADIVLLLCHTNGLLLQGSMPVRDSGAESWLKSLLNLLWRNDRIQHWLGALSEHIEAAAAEPVPVGISVGCFLDRLDD